MTLLAPWALWLFSIGGAVVAMYLLKIRRHRQTVPAIEFWRALVSQAPVRSLFQRLKRLFSLLLWLIIVALLVLATGNPIFSFGKIKPRSIAIILDNSASMQTIETEAENKTRLQLAKEAINELTSRRPVADEWMLIEAGREPQVHIAWTRDRRAVRDATDSIKTYEGTSDLAASKELAQQLLVGKQRPCIVIISDGANNEIVQLSTEDNTVVFWPIGNSDDNLGITHLSVRTHRQKSAHYAFIRVLNASGNEIETRIVFELDGSTAAVEPFTIAANSEWEKTVILNAPQGGVLRASIDRDDSLMLDNEAFAILDPIRSASTLLITPPEDAYFFEQALVAMEPLIDLDSSSTISPDEFDQTAATIQDFDLMIFNNCVPKQIPLTGKFIFVNGWPAELLITVSGIIDSPELFVSQRDHPLTRYLTLRAVMLAQAQRVELTERSTVLAQTIEADPLIFLIDQPDRQALCLAFDVLDSDLPFRNAFPMLLRNAVAFLVTEQPNWIRSEYHVGEIIQPVRPLPRDVSEITIARLSADEISQQTIPTNGESFTFSSTLERGPLRFSIGNEFAYAVINLTSQKETAIGPILADTQPGDNLVLTGRLLGMVPWLALTVIALALITLEWLTYHFRWTE